MADKQLNYQRGQIKAKLTRFKKYLDEGKTKPRDAIEFQLRLTAIESLWEQFNNIQTEIELAADSPEQVEMPERVEIEDSYFSIVAAGKKYLASLLATESPPIQVQSTPLEAGSSNTIQMIQPMSVRLPALDLPTFDGAYQNWMSFHDTFYSLIHNNQSLSNIQRFQYLKVSVKGAAANVIKSLELTSDNYNTAWALLKERFANERLIINTHVKALHELPFVTKDSPQSLRNLLDETNTHLNALKNLGEPIQHWDTLIIYLLTTRFDYVTKREWETKIAENTKPTINDITEFLKSRCQLLEKINPTKQANSSLNSSINSSKIVGSATRSKFNKSPATTASHMTTVKPNCPICNKVHFVFACDTFLKMSNPQRSQAVKNAKLCFNCLRPDHHASVCQSGGCRKCSKRHNTLLHHEQSGKESSTSSSSNGESTHQPQNMSTVTTHCSHQVGTNVWLSTALIYISDNKGKFHECRTLLDCGSQSNFITSDLCDRLHLQKCNINIPVTGINQTTTNLTQRTNVHIQSKYNSFHAEITCLVMPRITESLPIIQANTSAWRIPENITLADPKFNNPGEIDLLIGAGLFWELLCVGRIKLAHNQPILQKTVLGWIVAGPSIPSCPQNKQRLICQLSIEQQVQRQLERFWNIEECQQPKTLRSKEEEACELLFTQTTRRTSTGGFEVQMPLKSPPQELGESRHTAERRLISMERKLENDHTLKEQYISFLTEYETLGHMKPVETEGEIGMFRCYLPHHAVTKQDSSTTKVRVVFDGSAKTTTGVSVNDIQMIGPTIQNDLFAITIRFRMHKFVLTADVEKMYRQIHIQEQQQPLQCILWRENSSQPIKTYQLQTVTYGMTSAPYLAIRCLHQVAHDNYAKYPTTAEVILKDFYVDDLLTGASTIEQAQELKNELTRLLASAGFNLRKWNSNNLEIAEDAQGNQRLIISDRKEPKTLGLQWTSHSDMLSYSINVNSTQRVTKRNILSTIAQIFDPLGLVGPIIIKAKLILRYIWEKKLGWDETVPVELHTAWKQFENQIPELNHIEIPRFVTCSEPIWIEIHGFCDASERAYGACLYMRSINQAGQFQVTLLCGKSKIAPLKSKTLPRLELCGALLLARLSQRVRASININPQKIYYWCDSTITLAWISSSPNRWKTFIANRTSEIQELTEGQVWNHVATYENPADLISRGTTVQQLAESKLWWCGPEWLSKDESQWPKRSNLDEIDVPEAREHKIALVTHHIPTLNIFEKYSSLLKLQRIIAYCIRFVTNSLKPKEDRKIGSLEVEEITRAMKCLVRLAQAQVFQKEIQCLKVGKPVSPHSRLLTLSPFMDKDEIIRVGGRLKNSELEYNQKHPAVMSPNHKLTQLIISHEHLQLLHAGCQALLASLRTRYWILNGKNAVKGVIRNCIRCIRARPRSLETVMGDLPSARVQPSRPFSTSGVDYAGPFFVKEGGTRGRKIVKAYICLFVCFSTKAIHIELVSSLSTDAFLNALKRFIARRGRPLHIHSDNGTNFVGAASILKDVFDLLRDENHMSQVNDFLTSQGITWHFIPPRAPHFGGLWEAAIKSTKKHLIRVLGEAYLTFEEFYTILTQVEACLNSRPLCPLSSDPTDLSVLTPGHFIIGDSLTAIPESDLTDLNENRLSRYQRLQQITQHFWSRWQAEYLQHLQQRYKWHGHSTDHPAPGDMVLLHEGNVPPMKWKLGRIMEVHPGKDGVTRVVSIKTPTGVLKRPLSKISLLPREPVNNI